MAKLEYCKYCFGKGHETCKVCNGRGTIMGPVKIVPLSKDKGMAYREPMVCPECGGKGIKTCLYCRGDGIVRNRK